MRREAPAQALLCRRIAEEEVDQEDVRIALLALLNDAKPRSRSKRKSPQKIRRAMRPLEELDQILMQKPFKLTYVQRKLESLMLQWARDIGLQLPNAVSVEGAAMKKSPSSVKAAGRGDSYATPQSREKNLAKSSTPLETKKPESARHTQEDNGYLGDDGDSGVKANKKQVPAGSRKTNLTVDDETEDEPTPNVGRSMRSPSQQSRKRSLEPNVVAGQSVTPTVLPDGRRKRMRFTEVEKNAIRKGVRQFGFGKWSEIKSEYAVELRNRTNVNIKVTLYPVHQPNLLTCVHTLHFSRTVIGR